MTDAEKQQPDLQTVKEFKRIPTGKLDKNDNKTELITTSGIDDDDISAAIASASFVIPELKGEHLLIHAAKNTEIPTENDIF